MPLFCEDKKISRALLPEGSIYNKLKTLGLNRYFSALPIFAVEVYEQVKIILM